MQPIHKVYIPSLKLLTKIQANNKTNYYQPYKDWNSKLKTKNKNYRNKTNKISKTCLTNKITCNNHSINKKFLVIKTNKELKEFKCKWENKISFSLKIRFNTLLMIFSDKNSKIIKDLKISKLVNGITLKICLKNIKKYSHLNNILKLNQMLLPKALLKPSLILASLSLLSSKDYKLKKNNFKIF